MDNFEFQNLVADLTSIGQDETHPRVKVAKHLIDFRPTSKASVPSGAEMLMEGITGTTTKEFAAGVDKALNHNTSLDIVDCLDEATVIPGLFAKAAISGTNISLESRKALRKGIAEIPQVVGAIPSAKPKDSTNSSKPNAERRRKLRELFVSSGVISPYSQQQLEGVISAMEAYLDDQVS
jgi:hypothetical protein